MLDEPREPVKGREIAFKVAVLLLAAAFFIGVANLFRPARSGAKPATPPLAAVIPQAAPDRLVGEFMGRNYILRVYASPEGPLYTVCDLSGRVLREKLLADDVYRAFPDLDVKSLQAAGGTAIGVVEDGR